MKPAPHTRIWKITAAVIAVALIAWGLWSRKPAATTSYDTAPVTRGSVVYLVSDTGSVQPLERLSLSFPLGGKLATQLVHEGDRVAVGDTLAVLDTLAAERTLAEAEARVDRERAALAQLTAPLRSEEAAVQDASVAQAQAALTSTAQTARTTLAHVYTLAHDAVNDKVGLLFSRDSTSPSFGVTFKYGSTHYTISAPYERALELDTARQRAGELLTRLATFGDPDVPVEQALADAAVALAEIDHFLTLLANAVNRYTADDNTGRTVYEAYQTAVATARTSVSTARSELSTVQASYESARTALVRANRALDLAYAGVGNTAITTQQAAVEVALRGADTARTQLHDRTITAPIAGTITRFDPHVGETVGPYEQVAELMADGAYEIEVYIPEADIATVALGDPVAVTFDAFSDVPSITGEVARVALSETMQEGVPTYKTTIVFEDALPAEVHLRPGMTADVDITTDERDGVLMVPSRTVQTENGRTYVRVLENDTPVERDVVIGLHGSEGATEIVSGLSEGEQVVLYTETP